jgi:hypothetical protein
VAEHTYALRCHAAHPAWPPPPPRVSGALPAAAAAGGNRGGDSPHDDGDGWLQAMSNGWDPLPASTTSCDVASATAEVVKCIKAERHARSAVATLQHQMHVAITSLGHVRAAAAAAVTAAASTTPSLPLELPVFEGDPADRKAVVAHKRAVEAARVAHAEALEAAASAERAAKRAKRTVKPDAPARPSAATAAAQRPTAAQMVEETACAVERGSAEVEALRAQLTAAATALAAAERATDAAKRALSAAQATAAQASAAAAVSVQQPAEGGSMLAAAHPFHPTGADELRAQSSAMLPPPPPPPPSPGPQPLDVAWHSGAAGPSAPWRGLMRDIPPPGFWTALNVGGGFEASPIAAPPGDIDSLAV